MATIKFTPDNKVHCGELIEHNDGIKFHRDGMVYSFGVEEADNTNIKMKSNGQMIAEEFIEED